MSPFWYSVCCSPIAHCVLRTVHSQQLYHPSGADWCPFRRHALVDNSLIYLCIYWGRSPSWNRDLAVLNYFGMRPVCARSVLKDLISVGCIKRCQICYSDRWISHQEKRAMFWEMNNFGFEVTYIKVRNLETPQCISNRGVQIPGIFRRQVLEAYLKWQYRFASQCHRREAQPCWRALSL